MDEVKVLAELAAARAEASSAKAQTDRFATDLAAALGWVYGDQIPVGAKSTLARDLDAARDEAERLRAERDKWRRRADICSRPENLGRCMSDPVCND